MAETGSQVFVVANAPDTVRIAGWLRDDGLPGVRWGDGSEDTLSALAAAPAEVIVLDAGIRAADALAFADAVRAAARPAPQLVLLADEDGRVRHALDGVLFRADRFLRRPLSRAALLFAVRSCLQLGRADIAVGLAPAATAAALAVLGDIAPAPRAERDVGGVAGHTLAARIDEATREAVEAFLSDKLEEALNLPPIGEELEDHEEIAIGSALSPIPMRGPVRRPRGEAVIARVALRPAPAPAATTPDTDSSGPPWPSGPPGSGGSNGSMADIPVEVEPPVEVPTSAGVALAADAEVDPVAEFDAAARMPPVWRDPTVVLADRPSEASSATFVAVLREHMNAVEARLFGGSGASASALDEGAPPDIDLDAIGVTALTPIGPMADDPVTHAAPPPRATGDLAEEDVASVFGRLLREGFSGRVAFRRGDVEKLALFDDGRPVFAGSNQLHDRMGELLVREGKITRDQIARASDVVTQSGRRMGEILVDLGHLKRRELLPAVRRHIEDILYSLFSWDSGSYTAVAGPGGREEKIRLASPTALLIVEGIRRKVKLERLRALLGPPDTVLSPERSDDMNLTLFGGDVDLGSEEREVIELFDGERTLGDVLAVAPLGVEHVHQLAWALVALGVMRVHGREPGAARAAVQAPAAWSSGVADVAIDRERILAKHAHVREADYFLVLGVRRDASAFEIRRAHQTARRDYAPESFAPELQRELVVELAEIALVLDEAESVLHGDALRQSYLSHLIW